MQTYELATRVFCGVVVTNFMSTVGSLFRISASCILMVDRRGLVYVMVHPIEVLLHGGIAELFGFTRNWLHPQPGI
jgi:hypothetical protein